MAAAASGACSFNYLWRLSHTGWNTAPCGSLPPQFGLQGYKQENDVPHSAHSAQSRHPVAFLQGNWIVKAFLNDAVYAYDGDVGSWETL